ncbi:hypothetical protein AAG906_015489 [Vitis piasezkii]
MQLEQMDVKTTFLHGDLEELVYMRFDSYMIKIGYKRCKYDCCAYVKSLDDNSSFVFLLLYVDDMLIAAKSMVEVNKLKSLSSKEFGMKDLGAAKKILGMEIHKDRALGRLWLSTNQCPKTDDEVKDMSKVPYASAVGCLMYAMVCTRPDLAHVVSVSDPSVRGYVDADYAGDLDDRRSTTEYMAIVEAAKESLWLTGLVKELGIQQVARWEIPQPIVLGGVISYVSCLLRVE